MLLEVGRIGRPHGLRGEVMVHLVTDRVERVAAGSRLESRRGTLVVERSRPHQDAHLVTFEGVSSREQAEELRGTVLEAEAVDDETDDETLWVHELVGAEVVEVDGTIRGTVDGVQANPASDLLLLDDGALVPVRFVVSHQPGERVVVDVPPGLFEL